MAFLPAELLDDIIDLAVTLGIITPNNVTRICHRWRSYQKLIFKSVKLDPFDHNIPDLSSQDHSHLIPYIKELCISQRLRSPSPDNFYDLSPPFGKFLSALRNPVSMILCDSRVRWADVSPANIDAFCHVFRCKSFRSLEFSVHNPLPSWMLVHGLSVASMLTVHDIGSIIPMSIDHADLITYRNSLTCLELCGNRAVKRTTEFFLYQRYLANVLFPNVIHLVLEYGESALSGNPAIPYVELLLGLLGSQLEVLEIRVNFNLLLSCISEPILRCLGKLQHFNISFTGCSTSHCDVLFSVGEYMNSIFCGLPASSLLKSLSLTIDDRRNINLGAASYQSNYRRLLRLIRNQLPDLCQKKWPSLTSSRLLVNIDDGSFTKGIRKRDQMKFPAIDLVITWVLHVNTSRVEDVSD